MPQLFGGLQVSTHDLCCELMQAGHEPAVLAGLLRGKSPYLRNRIIGKLGGISCPWDTYRGVRVARGWDVPAGLAEALRSFSPDALIFQGAAIRDFELASATAMGGYPVYFYAHDVSQVLAGASFPDLADVHWIFNSSFSERTFRERLGVTGPVIPPCMNLASYKTDSSRMAVTMVNPRPSKGGHIVLDLAESCPDIPFILVEAWVGADREVGALKERAHSLRNVTWLPSQANMIDVYRRTRIILMPSLCQETWGRMITEAQVSGIPALVSSAGALPDTTGTGGLVVPIDAPSDSWVNALRAMWDDTARYDKLAESARAMAARGDLAPGEAARKLLAWIQKNGMNPFRGGPIS